MYISRVDGYTGLCLCGDGGGEERVQEGGFTGGDITLRAHTTTRHDHTKMHEVNTHTCTRTYPSLHGVNRYIVMAVIATCGVLWHDCVYLYHDVFYEWCT